MTITTKLSRRGVLAAALAAGFAPARAAGASGVVELFTSQGCSSCPAADEFAAELVREPGLTLVTYHVDYWDYLGWKDTLGGPEFSKRQYDYAKARGDMEVYTPQMIVNGGRHFSGVRHEDVMAALAEGRPAAPSLTLTAQGTTLSVAVGASALGREATIWLMPVSDRVEIEITKGENAGKSMVYLNVARAIIPAGMWSGAAHDIALPLDSVMTQDCTGCVAILQADQAGAILASASWGKLAV